MQAIMITYAVFTALIILVVAGVLAASGASAAIDAFRRAFRKKTQPSAPGGAGAQERPPSTRS